jgi:hypothetical protein
MDIRPPMDPMFAAMGVPATVTRPGEAPITTTVIWLSPLEDLQPTGLTFQRRDPIKVLVLRADDVPTVPLNTCIVAPELAGGADRGWLVDGYEQGDSEQHRVRVVVDPTF